MNNSIILLGAGGHAKVLIDCLQQCANVKLLGILDQNRDFFGGEISGVPILGDENEMTHFSPHEIQLVNGLGSVDIPSHRKSVFNRFKNLGYRFFSVIHPTACIASHVLLGEGVQLMAGCIIQPGCRIGDNVIVNTRAAIDHDCTIGSHTHLAPGSLLSGNVTIGEDTHIGTGAAIIQNIRIETACLVAAGAVVIRNVAKGHRVAGVPAKSLNIKEDEHEELEKYFSPA